MFEIIKTAVLYAVILALVWAALDIGTDVRQLIKLHVTDCPYAQGCEHYIEGHRPHFTAHDD